MHHLDQHVREPAVIVADRPLERRVVPFGKGFAEIAFHHVPSIRDHAPRDEREEARDGVPGEQRNPRKETDPQGVLVALIHTFQTAELVPSI